MADEIVSLWAYRDLPEALIAKGKLEAAGVDAFLADDNVVRVDCFWSNLIGGVKLRVAAKDRDAAITILVEGVPPVFTAEEIGKAYRQPGCPKCGSLDVSFEAIDRGVAFAALAASTLPVPIPKRSWKCEDCGARWTDTAGEDATS
jgi:hypothetical protein